LSQLREVAEAYMAGREDVDPALVDPALAAVARDGDPALYERFLQLSKSSPNPLARNRYTYLLSSFEKEDLVRRALEHALTPDVRGQDVGRTVYTAFGNPAGRRAAWAFLKANFDQVAAKAGMQFGSGFVVVGAVCEAGLIADMEAFYAAKKVAGAERTLRQGLERARSCVDLQQRQREVLHGWLERRVAGAE
jgi:aminopeptidase N